MFKYCFFNKQITNTFDHVVYLFDYDWKSVVGVNHRNEWMN